MLPLDLYLLSLIWACHVLFLYSIHIAEYFYWVNSHVISGSLGPYHSFGHPWPIPFLHSHKPLLHLLGFLSPITILYFQGFVGLCTNLIY